MIGSLFLKECRQILRSLIYYIYIVIFVLFITSQMGDTDWIEALEEPQPGSDYYGYGYSDDPDDIMEEAIETLFEETYRNNYSTYPFGFIKSVTLTEEELAGIKSEVERCTGKSFEELTELYMDYYQTVAFSGNYDHYMKSVLGWHIPIAEDLTYEEFERLMKQVSGIIGKGCMYEDNYKVHARKELGYEDAVANYRDLRERDRVTGAQMRLFCDYAGIVLSILPIFVGVSACLRDKRAKAADVIYSKKVSGTVLILSRYFANVLLLFVPVALCAALLQMPIYHQAVKMGMTPDGLAFLKYTVICLLPMIMIILALAFLITELTDKILAIPIQIVWAFDSVFAAPSIVGDFQWRLVTRWNEFGNYSRYAAERHQLYLNRGYYVVLSMICIAAAVIVYGKKRKEGVTVLGKISKSHR